MNVRVVKNWAECLREFRLNSSTGDSLFYLSEGVWYDGATDTVVLLKSELKNANVLAETPTAKSPGAYPDATVYGYDTGCFED
jgi:hypothetical protein